ncbi:GNAT family N-acetyltransferase [Kribbella sp. CA-245084]|uniref:GNAT family N-acetyltransferase n=1 Tax=Kribbella sp. CA-245084 TaxID=3239940 RepID=UPI003D8F97F4
MGQHPRQRHPRPINHHRRTAAEVLGWVGRGASDDPLANWSFGYAVLPTHRFHGYATEALTAALTYCHQDLAIPTLWGECHPTNTASAHVMHSAGLTQTTPSPNGSPRFVFPPHTNRPQQSPTTTWSALP